MFGRKHKARRSSNPLFVIFRLVLSFVMFALLLGGVYTAYKHFSGLDPLKLDPKQIISAKIPPQLLTALSAIKLDPKIIPSTLKESAQPASTNKSSAVIFKFMLVADSHSDNASLKKAISQAREKYPDLAFIIGLGDYTEVGTIDELKKAKDEFDLSTLRYFLLAGDHDLWDSRNRSLPPNTNFKQVFGPSYQSFVYSNYLILLLDNSDNYLGILPEQQKWISQQLDKATEEKLSGVLVFIHEPLYHPSSDHFMGRVEKQLKQQAKSLTYQLKAANVKKVFYGDTHYFSEYEEAETKLSMMSVGAITADRNPQAPRYAVAYVFEDGNIRVEDVEIR